MRFKPGDRSGIEDRRAAKVFAQPSAPDALLRGLPQTPIEMELYRQRLAEIEAYRAGTGPFPGATQARYGTSGAAGSPGDPAGLETQRMAALARLRELYHQNPRR